MINVIRKCCIIFQLAFKTFVENKVKLPLDIGEESIKCLLCVCLMTGNTFKGTTEGRDNYIADISEDQNLTHRHPRIRACPSHTACKGRAVRRTLICQIRSSS